jgi:hypothetical protein
MKEGLLLKMLTDYILVIVKWSYVPSGRAVTRNIPSEARRILMGPMASGPKHYPWILEGGLDLFLEPYIFSLIKPKEHKKTRGRVGPAEGAVAVFKIKDVNDDETVKKLIEGLSRFCEEWKIKGKYGIKISSYQIATSNLIVYK